LNTLAAMKARRQSNNPHWRGRGKGLDQTPGPSLEALLPIRQPVEGGAIHTVNARDLHAVLQVGRDYSSWFNGRVNQYGFQINSDFIVLAGSGENQNGTGGRPAVEHHISLDMAKELSMVENNPAGMAARRYFIEAEKRLRQVIDLPQTYVQALEAHLVSERQRLALEAEAEILRPKAAFTDAVIATKDTMGMAEAAQKLGTGQNRLFRALRAADVLIKHGLRYNLPYQHHVDVGRFVVCVGTHQRPDGDHNHASVRVTAKGLAFLHQLLKG